MSKSSQDFVLDPENSTILERREAVARGVLLFTAHWHVFVPSLIIAFLYGLIWAGLNWTGKADFGFARFFIVLMAVLVPLLFAWAFLRFQTIRLQIDGELIAFHPGWPQDTVATIKLDEVIDVNTHLGMLSRWFGGGDLIIRYNEERVVIRDLADPAGAASVLEKVTGTG